MSAFPQIVPDAASPEVVTNENFAAIDFIGCFSYDANAVGGGGLVRGYSGGRWGGFDVDDTVNTFGASTTTYVSADMSDGTFNFSTSNANFNDGTNFKRIEVVVTSGSAITSATDYRGGPGGVHGGAGGSGGGASRTPSVQSITSATTITPTFDDDLVRVTALAAAALLANPTGTPIEGIGIAIRIKDNGTARAITYDTQYRAIGVTLPATTIISKTLYLGCVWNDTDTKLDVVSVAQEP